MLDAVILAGGRGSRLGDLATHLPKPLWIAHGDPPESLLHRLIRQLNETHMERISVTCGYLGGLIAEQVLSRYPFCEIINQTDEDKTPADGILSLEGRLENDLLVVHGDHYFS